MTNLWPVRYFQTPPLSTHIILPKFKVAPSSVTIMLAIPVLGLSISGVANASINGIDDDNLVNPNTNVDAQVAAMNQPADNLFLQCATLRTDAARLACYDTVAMGGTNTLGREKTPLDLVQSAKASFTQRKPKIVLAGEAGETNEFIALDTPNHETEFYNPQSGRIASEAEILKKVGVTSKDIEKYTSLSLAYDLDRNSERGILRGRPHNPIYLMPLYATFDPNRSPESPTLGKKEYSRNEYQPLELKAQISVKTKVMEDLFDTNADLWFGYTQQMHWQVYNQDNSRPFRATDYMPELFITQPVKASLPFNGELRMLGAGAIHHSNGQSDPISRSWNRLYLMGGAEWGKLSIIPKVWYHVKNDTAADPSDNPDITDYYGHGEIKTLYDFGKGETIAATGRYNLDKANGAIEVNYTYPLTNDVHGFLQIFHGYGESIIDYNDKSTSVGIGLTLNDWNGL